MSRIRVDRGQGVVHVTMLDRRFTPELLNDLRVFRTPKHCQVVYFYGVDRRTWQLGGDLTVVLDAVERRDLQAIKDYARLCCEALVVLLQHPCVTVARVSGDALAGGFEALMACDEVQVWPGAEVTVGFPEYRLGFWPGMGAMQLLRERGLECLTPQLSTGESLSMPSGLLGWNGRAYVDMRQLYEGAMRWAHYLVERSTDRDVRAIRAAARAQRREPCPSST